MKKIIDSHIHLDHYKEAQIQSILNDLQETNCTNLITVSFNLESCRKNMQLAKRFPQVKPAFGYHPEQELITEKKMLELFSWMDKNVREMVAVGEVGLPYYLRQEKKNNFSLEGYIELLKSFLNFANKWDKPVILHAVYDDAPLVCDLLEQYNIKEAHFHWFKGDSKTIERMIQNGYYISITPDVLYEEEIQTLVKTYPIDNMMVETDGPWEFEGRFQGSMTHPKMIHQSIAEIASLKELEIESVYKTIYKNTRRFYRLN